jgi:hypothetical protein
MLKTLRLPAIRGFSRAGQSGRATEWKNGARAFLGATTGEVVKVDRKTGKTLARYAIPGGGGVHGLEFTNRGLWLTSLKIQKLSLVDPKDFHVIHQIPVHFGHLFYYCDPGIAQGGKDTGSPSAGYICRID